MINFYSNYNKVGLDKEYYSLWIEQLLDEKYTKELELIKHIIKKDPEYAFRYARDVIKGRFEEAEPVIMTDPYFAYYYSRDIIKGRWEEAEPIMKGSYWWDWYCQVFGI